MRFLRLLNEYEITNPELHCKDVTDYQSLSSARGIANTAIFNFELLVNSNNDNCTKCNSSEHLNAMT